MLPDHLDLPLLTFAPGDFVLAYDGDGGFDVCGPLTAANERSVAYVEQREPPRVSKTFTLQTRHLLYAGTKAVCVALALKLRHAQAAGGEARARAQEAYAQAIEAALAAAHALDADADATPFLEPPHAHA